MRKFVIFTLITIVNLFVLQELLAQEVETISGIVYHDRTGNQEYEARSDSPLKGIAVSNGREIVLTDNNGFYQLPLRDNSPIFVIKPRNWMVPVDDNNIPRFYHIHSEHGISGTRFEGLPPSGPIPESLNFPLYPAEEPDKFKVLVFGDTQTGSERSSHIIAQDAIPELIGSDAAFGVTLGDIVGDNPRIFPLISAITGSIGIPWRHVLGNHDIDFTGNNNHDPRGPWYKSFGPSYYSFDYGPTHFVILDNIRWITEGERRHYRTGLGEEQMEFFKNVIAQLKEDQLLVIMAHIPWAGSTGWQHEEERETFFELLASHPNSLSLVAHTHRHYHHLINEDDGFHSARPHHMISVGTISGSWFSGIRDEYGIPHSMMGDGTPNGYSFLHVNGNEWKLSYKAARRPADFQMHIYAPLVIDSNDEQPLKVTANIFNALPTAEVKMRIINNSDWIDMENAPQRDPVRIALDEREKDLDVNVRWFSGARSTDHIWESEKEINLDPGIYVIEVIANDEWWQYKGARLLHVK
jgi:hypothetical protein